jgi:histone H2A
VARMRRYLKGMTHHFRIGAGAPVYMAAVIEYLTGIVNAHSTVVVIF